MDGNGDQAVDDEPFINETKPTSTMAAKGVLNNGPVQKKLMEMATDSLMMNLSSTRGSH